MESKHWYPCASVFTMALVVLSLTVGCGDKPPNSAQTSLSAAPKESVQTAPPTKIALASTFRSIPIVYVATSYDPERFAWTRDVVGGIVQGFADGGLKQGVDYQMVSKTMAVLTHKTPEQMEVQANQILADIRDRKPDLVITADDDALKWVGLKLDDMPVVFNGVNGNPGRYLSSDKIDSLEKPGHNLTGVYQTTYYKQSLLLAKKLVPSARTFATITDKTTTGNTLLETLKTVDSASLPLQWKESFVSDQFSQWEEKIKAWQDQVDVVLMLCANAVLDRQGNRMTMKQAIDWIAAHSTLPDTACWTEQVRDGILVSATDDGAQQGRFSAALALKILQGAVPGELSILTPPNGVPALNLTRAKKLTISPSRELMSMFIENGVIFK